MDLVSRNSTESCRGVNSSDLKAENGKTGNNEKYRPPPALLAALVKTSHSSLSAIFVVVVVSVHYGRHEVPQYLRCTRLPSLSTLRGGICTSNIHFTRINQDGGIDVIRYEEHLPQNWQSTSKPTDSPSSSISHSRILGV
jgi:hypothetical protein